MVSRSLLLALALTCGCGGAAKRGDARFARGLAAATLPLEGGGALRAYPAVLRLDGAEIAIRAAGPQVLVRVELTAARRLQLRFENVPPTAELSPPASAVEGAGATELRARYDLEAGQSEIRLDAAPAARPFRFAAFSDMHANFTVFEEMVADVRARSPEFVVSMGDLTTAGDETQLDEVMARMAELERPFYSTLGNHELFGRAGDRFLEAYGPSTQALAWAGAQLLLIDSADYFAAPAVYPWLIDALSQRPPGAPSLAFTHIPPLDPSGAREHGFAPRSEGERMLQALSDGRVAHLFAGHVHGYAESQQRGIPTTIAGGAGGGRDKLEDVGFHYLEIEVDPSGQVPVRVSRRDLP